MLVTETIHGIKNINKHYLKMRMKYFKILFCLIVISCCFSCVGGKYTFEFYAGKNLDFGKGKWILNKTQTNSKLEYDKRFYEQSFVSFQKILGDSLIDMNSLRSFALISPEIKFEATKLELQELYKSTKCDYLINVKGKVIANEASGLSFNDPDSNYSTSNTSSASITIYDLKSGIILSSSKDNAIDKDSNSKFDKESAFDYQTRAEPMMLQAAERLISKYNKYRVDK